MSAFCNTAELAPTWTPSKKRVRRKPNKLDKKEQRTAFLFILPPVISFTIFTIIPLIFTIFLAFGDFNSFTMTYKFIGFANFQTLLNGKSVSSTTFYRSVTTTLCFIIEVPIAIMLGLLCAALANSKGCRNLQGKHYLYG